VKRSNKQKLQGFLLSIRTKYKNHVRKGQMQQARRLRVFLKQHSALMGVKDAA